MDRFEILRNVINSQALQIIRDSIVLSKDADYHLEGVPFSNTKFFGDGQCPDSWVYYGHPVCESLLLTVQPMLEKATGKRLLPTYTYCRIYWKGAILEKHLDRPSCQYSATLCISNNPNPWPIFMQDTKVLMEPGDLVVYKGMEVEHWREPYEGTEQVQIFLHFVDADDVHSNLIYDGRPCLGFDKKRAEKRVNEQIHEALIYHQQGKLELVRPVYENILKMFPNHIDSLQLLGLVELHSRNFDRARELISRAIELAPDNPAFHNNLGNVYQELNQYNSAIGCYNKALAIKPDFVDALRNRKLAEEKSSNHIAPLKLSV